MDYGLVFINMGKLVADSRAQILYQSKSRFHLCFLVPCDYLNACRIMQSVR